MKLDTQETAINATSSEPAGTTRRKYLKYRRTKSGEPRLLNKKPWDAIHDAETAADLRARRRANIEKVKKQKERGRVQRAMNRPLTPVEKAARAEKRALRKANDKEFRRREHENRNRVYQAEKAERERKIKETIKEITQGSGSLGPTGGEVTLVSDQGGRLLGEQREGG